MEKSRFKNALRVVIKCSDWVPIYFLMEFLHLDDTSYIFWETSRGRTAKLVGEWSSPSPINFTSYSINIFHICPVEQAARSLFAHLVTFSVICAVDACIIDWVVTVCLTLEHESLFQTFHENANTLWVGIVLTDVKQWHWSQNKLDVTDIIW